MPRHQHTQSAAPPAPPLNMEEMKFWLKIMEEHAFFIRAGLPCDQSDLIEEAKGFQQEFKTIRIRLEKIQNEKKFSELIAQICRSLKEFIRYKRLLLCLSLDGKLDGSLYPLFLDHVLREAEYFMALLAKIRGKTLEVVKALEADFWLHIMDDHTHLLRQLIDPSEKGIIDAVEGYAKEFDALSSQARAFSSMLNCQTVQFPVFDRFLKDSRAAAARLRDFKKALHDMICCHKLLSIIPPLLADHVRREADHFILVLAMMEKGVVKDCKYDEASAAKYYKKDCTPAEPDREFEELIEYEDDAAGATGSAPDFDRLPEYKPKFKSKTSPSGKKGLALSPKDSPQERAQGNERDNKESNSKDNKKTPPPLNDEPPAKFQPDLSLSQPDQKSLITRVMTQPLPKSSDPADFESKHLLPLSSSQKPKISQTPTCKTGGKWPRQLGKVSSQ